MKYLCPYTCIINFLSKIEILIVFRHYRFVLNSLNVMEHRTVYTTVASILKHLYSVEKWSGYDEFVDHYVHAWGRKMRERETHDWTNHLDRGFN